MPTPAPAPRRNPALVAADIVAGVILVVFGIAVGVVVFANALAYTALKTECDVGATSCGPTIDAIVIALMAVAVLALFLGVGLFIVALIRKRVGFYWPLAGIVLTLAVFYAGTWAAGVAIS